MYYVVYLIVNLPVGGVSLWRIDMSYARVFFLLSMLFFFAVTAYADQRGEEIAQKFFNLPKGETVFSETTLVIIDSKNKRRVRKIQRYFRSTEEGEESYIEFLEPADIRGSKILTISKKGREDEQRLYLPALGRVRRIASADKGGSFMGTDFSYYDLEDHDFIDYSYTFIGEQQVNKKAVYVVEFTPKNKSSPYSKEVHYMQKDSFFPSKVDYYDKKNKFLKSILNVKTELRNGVIIPTRVVVDNKQEGQKTLLQAQRVVVNQPVPERVFSIQNLER